MDKIIFILILIISILFFYIANKKNNKFFLFAGILLLSFTAGFRGELVGIDTKFYYNAFVNNFPHSWQFPEEGFRFVSRNLMLIFNNPHILFFIYSLIINLLIILRLWDFKDRCNFPFMTFLYLFIYYIETMNIMRQFIAIAIIFYSTRFLERRRILLFILIIIAATYIHKTALLGLFILVVYFWNDLSKTKKILLSIPILALLVFVVYYIINYESGHISNYLSLDNSISNINITFIYRVFAFIASFLLYKSNCKIVFKNSIQETKKLKVIDEKKNDDFNKIYIIYILGLCLSSLGMFFLALTRSGYYYMIFEILYWGYLARNSRNKGISICLISIFALYIFAIELIRNGSGIFPFYLSF